MQEVLDSVRNWSDTNKMKLNAMKTKGMWFVLQNLFYN